MQRALAVVAFGGAVLVGLPDEAVVSWGGVRGATVVAVAVVAAGVFVGAGQSSGGVRWHVASASITSAAGILTRPS
jgi:hypothetical protein